MYVYAADRYVQRSTLGVLTLIIYIWMGPVFVGRDEYSLGCYVIFVIIYLNIKILKEYWQDVL